MKVRDSCDRPDLTPEREPSLVEDEADGSEETELQEESDFPESPEDTRSLPYKLISDRRLLLRIRELFELEEWEAAVALISWGLNRPQTPSDTYATYLALKAYCLLAGGNLKEAAQIVDEAKIVMVNSEVVTAAIEVLLVAEKAEEAEQLLENHWDILEKDPKSSILAARVFASRDDIDTAIQVLENLAEEEEPPRGTFRALAEMKLACWGPEEALDYARRAAMSGYPCARDMILYGQILLEVERAHEAFAAFETAIYLKPTATTAYLSAVHSLIRLRSYDHAERLSEFILSSPASSIITLELTKILLLLGRTPQAAKLNHQILQKSANDVQALLGLTLLALHEGRYKEVSSLLQRVSSIPEHTAQEYQDSIIRLRAEYSLLAGDLQSSWEYGLPLLRAEGPAWPSEIKLYSEEQPLQGLRLLVRLCHPIRFLGFVPWLEEEGAYVTLLVHPPHRRPLEELTSLPMITSQECEADAFDALLDDLRLPLICPRTCWTIKPRPIRPPFRIGLALDTKEGKGPLFDIPDSLIETVQTRLTDHGFILHPLSDFQNMDEKLFETLLGLGGLLTSDHLLMDFAAARGIETVLLSSRLGDPIWRAPLKENAIYSDNFHSVHQSQNGSWDGVDERIISIFASRLKDDSLE